MNTEEPNESFLLDFFEFVALIPNALGYQGLETLRALNFGFGLEVVGTAVLAASRTPVEKTSTGEFITGRNYVFLIRVNIVSGVARQVLEVLCFLQVSAGLPWKCTAAALDRFVCGILLTHPSVSGSHLWRKGCL